MDEYINSLVELNNAVNILAESSKKVNMLIASRIRRVEQMMSIGGEYDLQKSYNEINNEIKIEEEKNGSTEKYFLKK